MTKKKNTREEKVNYKLKKKKSFLKEKKETVTTIKTRINF